MSSEAKTRPTPASVADFIAALPDDRRRADAEAVCALLGHATGFEPVMWGASIIGFGAYHYRYESGREGDAPLVGFSPRKANLVLYLAPGEDRADLLGRLGKHKAGVGCVYVNRLSDVDIEIVAEMARWTIKTTRERYPD